MRLATPFGVSAKTGATARKKMEKAAFMGVRVGAPNENKRVEGI